MRLAVSMEELYAVPIERVWHALTDPAMIKRWLMEPDGYEAKVGTRFILWEPSRSDCRGRVECEVLELSPPNRLVWSWRGDEDPTTTRLVIDLEADGQGTRLTLRHAGESDERTVRGVNAGWTAKLGALTELLTTTGGDGND
jgi:uncharacterized protein YndB with AHSA1/START domain